MTELNVDADLEFAAKAPDGVDFSHEEFTQRLGTGWNEYGVRTNYDQSDDLRSVDVIFGAMEPGPPERRNGVRITEDFLRSVASKDYSDEPPHLKDHKSRDTFADLGTVREVWFSERLSKLMLMVRVPNTGAPTHTEAVSRYTFEPPAIRNGSVGFGRQYTAEVNDDGEPELVDGKLREFSTVNFPGGYDDGGVAAAFAEEAVEAADAVEVDDAPNGDDGAENSAAESFSVDTETITF